LAIQFSTWRPNRKFTFENGARSHLELNKVCRYGMFVPQFTKIGGNVAALNSNSSMSSKYAWWPEYNMAVAAIFNFKK